MFKYILLFVAIAIACCAGFFSVTGIGQLFISAHISAIFMAMCLEMGKIVSVTFLYRYFKDLNKVQRTYLLISSIIISCITSFGIYGYLSSAYSTAAVSYKMEQAKIDILTTQQNGLNNLITENQKTIDLTRSSISKQDNRLDSLVGKNGFLTQQQNNAQSNKRLDILQKQNSNYIKQRDSLELLKVQENTQLSASSKISTFNYIASILHTNLDTVAKYFILIIVLVFDPLSLNLVIAYNFIEEKERKNKISVVKSPDNVPIQIPEPSPIIAEVPRAEVMAHVDRTKEREGVRAN